MKRLAVLITSLMLIMNGGCSTLVQQDSAVQQMTPIFRPPAAATMPSGLRSSQPALIDQGTPETASQPDSKCQDNLTFIQDLTIPDGTEVTARATMDKRWEVENSGTCGWNGNYRIRLIAGSEIGAQKEQSLYPARSGTQAVIRILFQAPTEAGSYRSAWQAFNTQGEPFGDPFFIDIIVTGAP